MKDFANSTIAYLGPRGTFTEEALRSQTDLAAAKLIPFPSWGSVMEAIDSRGVDYAFVAIENSIEGTVSATIDPLIFDYDLFILREVVYDVHLNLMGIKGAGADRIQKVLSFPHALAQCRGFLADRLPLAETVATNSTSDAARMVAESGDSSMAALAPSVSAELYDLEILEKHVEDHTGNQTRFFLLNKDHLSPRSGHDKTTVVCFQIADRPGSLISILAQFSARNINLTKLESRPSKTGLGQYCFVIDLEGHIEDPIIADTLSELHRSLPEIKFIGSYPAAGATEEKTGDRRERSSRANAWLDELLARIEH